MSNIPNHDYPQPPAYLLGVDVSVYNGKMDWARCYQAGARVAVLRAAVGLDPWPIQ